ncbi:MAG: class I SAM-dependent methyltransferase [Bacteroidetes bacterium]|nr:class I SAM-dependent methyltransferase [Bacteroidota bacterium]
MQANKETLETWNKIASLYQDKFMDLDIYNDSYNHVCRLLKERAKVLDVGCGPGNITKYLLSIRPDFEILGIDTSANMIELAKKNNPTAKFSLMDCRQMSELQQKFDGIICGFCLPYLTPVECAKLLYDAISSLKENGVIYLSFVDGHSSKSGFQVGSSGDRIYFHYHTLQQMKSQLVLNGFDEPEMFKVAYEKLNSEMEEHTIFIARKKANL